MSEGQAEDVADDQRHDLDIPDRVGAEDLEIDPGGGSAEQIGRRCTERIGEQVGELRLLLVDEEAEVVGDEVGERDRDQGVSEAAAQLRGRRRSRDAAHAANPERVDQPDAGEGRQHEDRVGEAQRRGQAEAGIGEVAEEAFDRAFEGPLLRPSKLVEAIEAITTAAEPGSVAHFVAAVSGRRRPSRPLWMPTGESWENIPK